MWFPEMILHLQIYPFPSPWKKLMELLPLKIAPFYKFLIGDHLTGDFKMYNRSAHSGKEFQAGKKAVAGYWCYWIELYYSIHSTAQHTAQVATDTHLIPK